MLSQVCVTFTGLNRRIVDKIPPIGMKVFERGDKRILELMFLGFLNDAILQVPGCFKYNSVYEVSQVILLQV